MIDYRTAAAGRALGKTEFAGLARNSVLVSFLPGAAVAAYLAALDASVAEHG